MDEGLLRASQKMGRARPPFRPRVGLAAAGAVLTVVALMVAVGVFMSREPLFGAERPVRSISGIGSLVRAVVFSPDGQLIVTRSPEGAQFWDATTGDYLGRLRGPSPLDMQDTMAIAPDGRTFGWLGRDNQTYRWDLATVQELPPAPAPFEPGAWATVSSTGDSALSPDGRTRATYSGKAITLSEAGTGRELGIVRTSHTESIKGVVFSPDGRLVLSTSGDGTMMLWDVVGTR
jgi:WD40 repeat protein